MLRDIADRVAHDWCASRFRRSGWFTEFEQAVARNTILDCLYSAPEDNFIEKATADPLIRDPARAVIKNMAPDLVDLAGRVLREAQHA
ncbi:MAG: hypothetical protein AAF368_03970 [Planctomycetota bacterium]